MQTVRLVTAAPLLLVIVPAILTNHLVSFCCTHVAVSASANAFASGGHEQLVAKAGAAAMICTAGMVQAAVAPARTRVRRLI